MFLSIVYQSIQKMSSIVISVFIFIIDIFFPKEFIKMGDEKSVFIFYTSQ